MAFRPGSNDNNVCADLSINTWFTTTFSLNYKSSAHNSIKMFVPIMMNLNESDSKSIEKELFVAFRKTLKKLLRNEYYDIFEEVCDEPLSRNIMSSLKDFTLFNGEVFKQDRISNPVECGIMIANIAFTMFQILCTLQHEYHVKKHMKRLGGIVSDAGRGRSAIERVVFAINTIYDISSNHEIFDIIQDDITKIDSYMSRTFACEIEFN